MSKSAPAPRLASVEIPRNRRGSKHDFTREEQEQAVAMLAAGEHPGGGPYSKLSEARRAGIRLTEQIADTYRGVDDLGVNPDDIGVRSWEGVDGFYFGLRIGRRRPRKA